MDQFDTGQILAMLKTPEGKKLLQLMQKDGGAAVTKAVSAAKQGNSMQAQAALAPLLAETDAEALIKALVNKSG